MANNDEHLQQQIIHQLDGITTSVEFYAEFLNNFKRDQMLHPDKHEKYLKQSPGRIATFHFNYITLLTKNNDDRNEAFETNRKVLLDHPENFIALCCSVEMCSKGDEKDLPQAQQHIDLLENIRHKKIEMILAKTEVGAIYTHFGAEFYRHSIELYEEALSEVTQLPEEEAKEPYFYDTIMKVRINLAKNLNKLMSGGLMEEYWPNSGLDHPSLYKKIANLLNEVMRVEPLIENGEHLMDVEDFERQKSTASAELGFATSKYLNWRNRMELPVEDLPSPDTCFETAMEIAADTPYVLEKYGQYLRYQADKDRNMTMYDKAVTQFQRALELEPSRYLAAHELGRTFKSMWLLNDTDNDNKWPTTSPQNRGIKFPCELIDPRQIPKPIRTPTWKEARHSFNPISKDPSNEHCSQSVKYFEEACELDNNSCSLYLADLARMYMSTNRIEDAKMCLDRAEQLKFTNAKSASTLSVQLAMWYQHDMSTNPDHTDSIRKAIRYYRSAIGYMVMCSFNPNFAFINLCHLLYQETQDPANKNDEILQREYFITLFVMENANQRSDLSIFLTHGKMLMEVLKLIQLFHERDTGHDCAAAFVYITILEKNNLSAFEDYFGGPDKQTMLLKISERAAETGVFPENTLSMSYRWFLYLLMQPHDTRMQPQEMRMQPHNMRMQNNNMRMQPHDMRMQLGYMRMHPHNIRMQYYDTRMQNHAMQMQPDYIRMQPRNLRVQFHNMQIQPHGMRMQPRGMRMQPHDMRMQPHDMRMQPHGMRMQPPNMPMQPQKVRMETQNNMVCLFGKSRKDQKTAKVLQILALCNLPVFQVYTEDFKNSDDRSIKDVQLCATVIIKDENPDGNQASLKNVFQRIADVNKTIGTKPVCLASFGTPDHIEFLTDYSTWLIPEEIGETDVRQAVDCGFKLLRAIFFVDSKNF